MILSAYERRGYAKLFSNEDQIRGLLHTPVQTLTASRGVTPQNTGEAITIMQPANKFELSDSLIRIGVRGVSKGLRKIAPRFVPYLGWAVTAKDIYDFATD